MLYGAGEKVTLDLGQILVIGGSDRAKSFALELPRDGRCRAVYAASAVDAISLLRTHDFSTIIVDDCCPNSGGFALLEYATRNFPLIRVRVLLVESLIGPAAAESSMAGLFQIEPWSKYATEILDGVEMTIMGKRGNSKMSGAFAIPK